MFVCLFVGLMASACKRGASGKPGIGRVKNLTAEHYADEDETQDLDDELGIFGISMLRTVVERVRAIMLRWR